uniref:Ribosomal protein L13 n=1 Tax=Sporolithon durum TaxID=48970 RepID=A0A141SD75_9FLOR|nr:ribosomal protein L13 [Sporolithon durum]AMK96243.1 ribosomal protein L13 [Sporolithon durum]
MNKTYIPSQKLEQKWYLINAKNLTLGRLSTKISTILTGKNNPIYTPHFINTSYIIIINSAYIKVTGKKFFQKLYKRHSGKPGSLKVENFTKLQSRLPNKIIEKSIKGMLPKNNLGHKLFTHLKIYPGSKHPHNAQNPQQLITN